MAIDITNSFSTNILNGRKVYNKISANGTYEILLDNTKNYIFLITKLSTYGTVILKALMNDANAGSESFPLNEKENHLYIDKKDKVEIVIDNIVGDVTIESYIK